MNKIITTTLAAAAWLLTACTPSTPQEYAEEYRKLVSEYYEAGTPEARQDIYDRQVQLEAEAAKNLSESDYEIFQNLIHPKHSRAYPDRGEEESVEVYVAEHNRLLNQYKASTGAVRDSLYNEMVNLERLMRRQHSKKSYEQFITRRNPVE